MLQQTELPSLGCSELWRTVRRSWGSLGQQTGHCCNCDEANSAPRGQQIGRFASLRDSRPTNRVCLGPCWPIMHLNLYCRRSQSLSVTLPAFVSSCVCFSRLHHQRPGVHVAVGPGADGRDRSASVRHQTGGHQIRKLHQVLPGNRSVITHYPYSQTTLTLSQ